MTEWLKSGAAASLCKETLPAEAVKYIRSAASARNSWWPAHGMELDIWCLTTGVVNEERLFEEWTASSAPAGDRHNFFEAELQEPLRVAVTSRRSFNRVIADGTGPRLSRKLSKLPPRCRIALQRGRGVERLDGGVARVRLLTLAWVNRLDD